MDMERSEFHSRQFSRRSALTVAAGGAISGGLIATGLFRHPSEISMRITKPVNHAVISYYEMVEGTFSGSARPGDKIILAVQGITQDIPDPHTHPQGLPVEPTPSWHVDARFGYYENAQNTNLKTDVSFDVIAYLASSDVAALIASYLQTGELQGRGDYPGFLPSQLPVGLDEYARVRYLRQAMSDSQIQLYFGQK